MCCKAYGRAVHRGKQDLEYSAAWSLVDRLNKGCSDHPLVQWGLHCSSDTLSSVDAQSVRQRHQALSVSEYDNFVMMDMILKLHYALDVGDQRKSAGIRMVEECKHEEQRPPPV
jgi:hypothetical protein